MERPYICEGNKYTISGTNTIGLPVPSPDLPKEIEVEGNKLLLKSIFHVSLVCINEIIKKYNVSNPGFRDSVLNDFCEFTSQYPVEFLRYTGDFKYCEQDNLKTVIATCEVSYLRNFFKILNKKYELALEYPVSHVTLYAHDGKTGIFLIDSKDINDFTKPISNPTGVNL